MAGARYTIEFDGTLASNALSRAMALLGDVTPIMRDYGEYLLISHRDRFQRQVSPAGTPWAPLSPEYQAQKKKNASRILVLEGFLANTLRYNAGPDGLEFGTNRPYGAVMQYGAAQGAFGRTRRGGPIPRGDIPARPWLGHSAADDRELVDITQDHLQAAIDAQP